MTKQWFCSTFGICITFMLACFSPAAAQEGQGRYIMQATERLTKLVDTANQGGYLLQTNSFSVGGGWLQQSQSTWVPLFTVQLNAGSQYRFLGAGDADTRDLDLQVADPSGKVVAADQGAEPEATVNYQPKESGRYTVSLRLYASDKNQPCMCLGVVMMKK